MLVFRFYLKIYKRELPYIKLEQTNVKLKTYDGYIMKPCGEINVELNYGSVIKEVQH